MIEITDFSSHIYNNLARENLFTHAQSDAAD